MSGEGPVMDPDEYNRRRHPERYADSLSPQAALKHGIYASGLMICDECACRIRCAAYERGGECGLEAEYAPARAKQVREVLAGDGQDPELHQALITAAVFAEVRLGRAMRFLALRGELLPEAQAGQGVLEYQPVAKEVPRLQKEVRDGLDVLNLTPAARLRLEQEKSPAANALVGLVRELALERQAAPPTKPLEAQFTAEDDEGEGEEGEGG